MGRRGFAYTASKHNTAQKRKSLLEAINKYNGIKVQKENLDSNNLSEMEE